MPVVEPQVGDPFAVGGHDRFVVRAVALGQRGHAPVGQRYAVDLGIVGVVLPVLVTVGRKDERLTVRRPRRRARLQELWY